MTDDEHRMLEDVRQMCLDIQANIWGGAQVPYDASINGRLVWLTNNGYAIACNIWGGPPDTGVPVWDEAMMARLIRVEAATADDAAPPVQPEAADPPPTG